MSELLLLLGCVVAMEGGGGGACSAVMFMRLMCVRVSHCSKRSISFITQIGGFNVLAVWFNHILFLLWHYFTKQEASYYCFVEVNRDSLL